MTHVSGPWLRADGTQQILKMLEDAGAQAFAVGGCVRNTLLGEPVADVDLATDALPEEVLRRANHSGFRAIPTGIEHGTVTILADGAAYEVTTFRRDIATDGRHAVVRFSDSVAEDAARRDFTMNALYVQRDGTLVDPLGGYRDLCRRVVRFIGNAEERIREDYLRSLRYFRFFALYGDPDAGFDPDALAAIANNLEGVRRLSHERIGAEVLKLLSAPDPAPAIATMRTIGLLALCLPGSTDVPLPVLVALEQEFGLPPSALRRLALLGGEDPTAALRLSRAQSKYLQLLRCGMSSGQTPEELAFRHGPDMARDTCFLRSASTGAPLRPDLEDQIERGARAQFPLTAADLIPDYAGRALGVRLRELEQVWIDSGFTLDKAALMAL